MLAWLFIGATLPEGGVTLRREGGSGWHASERLIDALQYELGSTICRVQIGGTIKRDDVKIVASELTILWRIDGAQILQEFAEWCAIQASLRIDGYIVMDDICLTARAVASHAALITGDEACEAQNAKLIELVLAAGSGSV